MAEDCGSWFPQQYLDWQAPNMNYDTSLDLGQKKTVPLYLNSGNDIVSTNGNLAAQKYSKLPQPNIGQPKETSGWFYCLPRFRQGFVPATDFLRGKLLTDPPEHCITPATDILGGKILANPPARYREVSMNNMGAAGRNFLVFDHSGDQTTLIFNSGIQTRAPCPTPWSPKHPSPYNVSGRLVGARKELNALSLPVLTDDFEGDENTDLQSDMREDTEELNALLYSDDESDSTEDDEVTSTGHSPSAMTTSDNHHSLHGSSEEVYSSVGSTKKRKTFDGRYEDIPSLKDSAYSAKSKRSYELEDDGESSCGPCGNGRNLGLDEMESSGNKRMQIDKIRQTLRILHKIVPGAEGKEAIMLLDEAIRHLKSLKTEATALGLAFL